MDLCQSQITHVQKAFIVCIGNNSLTSKTTDDSIDRTDKLYSWRQSTKDVQQIGHIDLKY